MKAPLLLIAWIIVCQHKVYGQGTLNFSNLAGPGGSSVNAPITNAAGNRIVGPSPYLADLYWSSDTNSASDSLMPAGFNQSFSTSTLYGGGHFIGGSKTMPVPWWILAQVRVWDATYGTTYAQARGNGGEFGFSNPILIFLSLPPAAPTDLVGLQGFQLGVIPEPSAAALTVIGGAALFFCRRRARKSARAHRQP